MVSSRNTVGQRCEQGGFTPYYLFDTLSLMPACLVRLFLIELLTLFYTSIVVFVSMFVLFFSFFCFLCLFLTLSMFMLLHNFAITTFRSCWVCPVIVSVYSNPLLVLISYCSLLTVTCSVIGTL